MDKLTQNYCLMGLEEQLILKKILFLKVNGKMEKWMDLEEWYGLMGIITKDNL
jgi:hypothetical protein